MMPNAVRFYSKPKLNKAKSAEAGQPVFDEVEMCEITVPGDRGFQPHFPAHEPTVTYDAARQMDDTRTWAERYPSEYQAFKMGMTADPLGTPLDQWPVINRSKASELRALGLQTVEQVAEMNARNRAILGPAAQQIIDQARVFVEQSRVYSPQAEIEALRRELADMRMAQTDDGQAMTPEEYDEPVEQPSRRGRPRKDAA